MLTLSPYTHVQKFIWPFNIWISINAKRYNVIGMSRYRWVLRQSPNGSDYYHYYLIIISWRVQRSRFAVLMLLA